MNEGDEDSNSVVHRTVPANSVDARIDRALRWRLLLGRYASEHLPRGAADASPDGGKPAGFADAVQDAEELEKTLDFVYDREFARRAHRDAGRGTGDGLTIPAWLGGVRELFPREAAEVLERDALYRYGLTELVTDPEILGRAEPTTALLKAIVQFKHLMSPEVIAVARARVKEIVATMQATLETECLPALTGPQGSGRAPKVRVFRNVDWTRTIRRNLKHWDRDAGRLVAERIDFRRRTRDRSRWRIVISVDQSGSMTDSLIHAAVMAAIFAALPAVSVNLVLWDHRIVDASDLAADPLEVLMGVQLGGGTDMLPALKYGASLITEPERTVYVVLSDFHVWGDRREILGLCEELAASGVKGVGLCALDSDAMPVHDEQFARDLADRGWLVGALTPGRLAEVVSRFLR